MSTLHDVREAHQMWERKVQNAGREGIVLNCGKSRSLVSFLCRIFRKKSAKSACGDRQLTKDYQPA
jgi:hypothetical protein